jgi:hypothetical protein
MTTLLQRLKEGAFSDDSRDDFEDDFGGELLADFPEELAPDPAPGKTRATRPTSASSSAPAKRPPAKVTAGQRKQLVDELETYAKLVALAWSTRDEYCGGVLNDQSRAIADSLAALLARNPKLVQAVHTGGLLGDVLKLGTALLPVVTAIRQHHITKTAGQDDGTTGVDLSAFPAYQP